MLVKDAVFLIACSRRKGFAACKAVDLYQGDIFKKSLQYAKRHTIDDQIFILSAKYGLLRLDQQIEPYDLSIRSLSKTQRQHWAREVLKQLGGIVSLETKQFVILAPVPYREHLLPFISNYQIPLEGLTQGRQKQRLNELNQ